MFRKSCDKTFIHANNTELEETMKVKLQLFINEKQRQLVQKKLMHKFESKRFTLPIEHLNTKLFCFLQVFKIQGHIQGGSATSQLVWGLKFLSDINKKLKILASTLELNTDCEEPLQLLVNHCILNILCPLGSVILKIPYHVVHSCHWPDCHHYYHFQ